MSLYRDFEHPIRDGIVAAHTKTLESFAAPGTWWNAAQRRAIVEEARDARCQAGLQEPLDSANSR
ncbi:MAG: alkylhydroperoxidase-related (seleno)protein, partial [Gammaproteobacteria bacterium]